MRALGRAIGFNVPMCLSRVLLGLQVVSTKGTYGILVPMNTPLLQPRDARELITLSGRVIL